MVLAFFLWLLPHGTSSSDEQLPHDHGRWDLSRCDGRGQPPRRARPSVTPATACTRGR